MLERKPISHFDKEILTLLTKMRFKHNRILINGSSTIRNLHYFGDIDMFSQLKTKYNSKELFNGIKNILFKLKHSHNYYFLELKVQLTDGEKIRVMPGEKFLDNIIEDNFKKIDFIKIDLAFFSDFRFLEASCIYQVAPQKSNIIKSIKDDISKFQKERKYFKMIKRMFSLFNLERKTQHNQTLMDFFNNASGYQYVVLSNIETILRIKEHYSDHLTHERILINLKMLNINSKSLETTRNEIESQVNEDALNFIKRHF